jgi:ribosome-associated translation inhibitor RaiA
MQVPLQICFRNIAETHHLETLIRERASKLERFYDRIGHCRVVVEKEEQSTVGLANPYRVRADLTIPPGHSLVAEHSSDDGESAQALEHGIRETFSVAERQVKALVRKRRTTARLST